MNIVSRTIGFECASKPVFLGEKEISLPLAPDFVVVELDAMSLNPVDMKIKSMRLMGGNFAAGRDFSGTVKYVADNLKGKYTVGDKVCGCLHTLFPKGFVGSYTLVNVKADSLVPVPRQFSPVEAAAFPLVFLTAWEMLEDSAIDPQKPILVLGGATAVGTMTIQLLKLKYDVKQVVATCSSRSSDYVKSFGADATIDYSSDLQGQLRQYASSQGKFTSILDCVGGREVAYIAGELLDKTSGKSNFLSVAGDGSKSGKYALDMGTVTGGFTMMGRSMFGRMWGVRYKLVRADNSWSTGGSQFLRENTIKVPIDSVYAYEDALKGWEKVESMKARGKVVVEFKPLDN